MMIQNFVNRVLLVIALGVTCIAASAQRFPLDVIPVGATAIDVVAGVEEIAARKALRIELANEVGGDAKNGPSTAGVGATLLNLPLDFKDGTIEVDLLGKLNGKGPTDARAFIGITFRNAANGKVFESVYFRPTNGRKAKPGSPRDKRAIQYFAYPDWEFARLRKEFPDGRHESGADIIDNEWFRARLEIAGVSVKVFVNDKLELTIDDMRLGAQRRGGIGLWVTSGTQGYFANLVVTPK